MLQCPWRRSREVIMCLREEKGKRKITADLEENEVNVKEEKSNRRGESEGES